jgi:ribose/xylose/arabinose/galactoside ABC-type transport system permease subunit
MLYRAIGLLIFIALFIVVSTSSLDTLLAVVNSLFKTAPPLIIISIAAGLVISCGQIDIASGSVFALTGMILFFVINFWAGDLHSPAAHIGMGIVYLAVFISIVFAVLTYVGIGLSVASFGFPALLSTLAVLLAGRGVSVFLQNLINGGLHVGASSGSPPQMIAGTLSLPPSMQPFVGYGWVWALVICIGLAIWRYKSYSGLRHIAIGMDERSADTAGVDIQAAQILAFVAAGALIALSALLTLFQVSGGGWAGNFGWGLELSAIAAAVIGGCRITGGRFDPWCISLGAIFVRVVEDAAGSFNLPSEFFYVVLGVGLLLAATLDRLPSARAAGRFKLYR